MKIVKALKVKNRLVGELNVLRQQASQYNVIDTVAGQSIVHKLDLAQVWTKLVTVWQELVDIRSKIAVASANVAPKLIKLAELKSLIEFYKSVDVQSGRHDVYVGAGAMKEVFSNPYITLAKRNELSKITQDEIDKLQDEIDEYNASTDI